MLPRKPLPLIVLLPMLLLVLLSGCATAPRTLVVDAPRLPLPAEARQPPPEPLCQPSCSAKLASLLDAMQPSPTTAAGPAQPASGSVASK